MRARAKAAIARGRRAAEQIMTDTCRITRPTGGFTTDPDTGADVPSSTVVYPVGDEDGRCKLTSTPQTGEQRDSEVSRFSIESPRLHLPVSAAVRVGDLVEIVASEENPGNVGPMGELTDLNRGTYRTAQRWNLEVSTR